MAPTKDYGQEMRQNTLPPRLLAMRRSTSTSQHVDFAQHVLVSGFGMINYDRGLGSGAAILARAE